MYIIVANPKGFKNRNASALNVSKGTLDYSKTKLAVHV